jgi:alkyl hydroperoxide reductase subunit AhpC
LTQLRQHKPELDSLNVAVKIVTFDDNFLARAYVKETGLEWPLLLDAEQKLYRAYGFQRASWWKLLNPVSIIGYLKLIVTGTLPGRPGRDVRQLGGDVIIDPSGTVRLHHISTSPHDRPNVSDMLSLIRNRA